MNDTDNALCRIVVDLIRVHDIKTLIAGGGETSVGLLAIFVGFCMFYLYVNPFSFY